MCAGFFILSIYYVLIKCNFSLINMPVRGWLLWMLIRNKVRSVASLSGLLTVKYLRQSSIYKGLLSAKRKILAMSHKSKAHILCLSCANVITRTSTCSTQRWMINLRISHRPVWHVLMSLIFFFNYLFLSDQQSKNTKIE